MNVHSFGRAKLFMAALLVGVATGATIIPALRAATQGESYVVSDVAVEYPYQEPSDTVASLTSAGVSFVAGWPSGGYPGRATCEITLLSQTGQRVGGLSLGVDVASDGGMVRGIEIPVTEKPASAEATCSQAQPYESGEGYTFEGPTRVTSPSNPITGLPEPHWTEISFDVTWQGTAHPGMRLCDLTVSRIGEADQKRTFGVNVGEGPTTLSVPGDPTTVRSAAVTCRPLP